MLHPTMLMMSDQHHRESTYRDITSAPTFLVRMLGKLLEFTGIEYTIQDGGLPFNSRGDLPSMRS